MKYVPLVTIGLIMSCMAFGQVNDNVKSIQYDTLEYFGSIVLPDRTKLSGYLVFNDNDGIVTFRNNAGQRSFSAKTIQSFEFEDHNTNTQRSFYALEFYDNEAGKTSVDFFEVLKEFESFAVLVRLHRLEAKKAVPITTAYFTTAGVQHTGEPRRTISQSKTIYFVSSDGNFQPYSRVTVREAPDDLLIRNSQNFDILNGDLIEKYTGPYYVGLKKFAKERKLKFNRQDDLLIILNEYEAVLNKQSAD